MPNGRPTKYKEEYCKEVVEFAKICEPYNFALSAAVHFKICRETLHEWRRQNPKFSHAYNEALGIWGARMTQHCLDNKIDYRYYRSLSWQVMRDRIEPDEKQEITHKVQPIDAMIKEIEMHETE